MEIQQLNVFSNEFIMFESVIAINVGNFVFNENGLGKTRSPMLKKIASDQQLRLMEQVKLAFDPQRLLNPRNMK